MPSRRYRFGPGIILEIAGPSRALEFFEAEYGPAALKRQQGPVQVEASFIKRARATAEAVTISGRHKTVGWEIHLSEPGADPLRASIAVTGRPRPFGLSLVQGFFVEPLVSVALSRSGGVLLPAAAIVEGAGALVLIGRSRSGKSSVSALALARGRPVLGDDQVIIGPSGECRFFPRRLRLYHDLPEVAPAAYRRLSPPTRRSLAALRLLASASRGYMRPPLRLAPSALGGSLPPPAPLPITRAVLLERSTSPALRVSEADLESLARESLRLLEEQRSRLAAHPSWKEGLRATLEREEAHLRAAFTRAIIERLVVPHDWPPAQAVAAIARHLGVA